MFGKKQFLPTWRTRMEFSLGKLIIYQLLPSQPPLCASTLLKYWFKFVARGAINKFSCAMCLRQTPIWLIFNGRQRFHNFFAMFDLRLLKSWLTIKSLIEYFRRTEFMLRHFSHLQTRLHPLQFYFLLSSSFLTRNNGS